MPVILLLGAIFLVWPLLSGLSLFAGPKSSLSNTEILIDRSVAMNESFWGGQSKLEFTQETIADKLLSQPSSNDSSWAIRQFGGPCDGENTSLVTPFSPGNIDQAYTDLAGVEIDGDTSFTQGMTAAIEDLADPELFVGKINTIIGIVGTSQICQPESAANTLNARMGEISSRIHVRIIGVGIPDKERSVLEQTAQAMGGKAYYVGTGTELEETLIQISLELREVLEEFNEGDGTFLQTPVPLPPPPPTLTPASTVEAATEAVEASEAETVAEPEPAPTPTEQPTAIPEPEAAPEPTPVPTAVPTPTAMPTPVPTPVAIATPRPTAVSPVVISNDTEPLPALPADCFSQFQPTPPDTGGQALPHVFAGIVSVDGAIPPDGTVVTARINGLLAAVVVLKDGNYTLPVEPPPGRSYTGKKVIFSVGECQASPTAIWQTARVDRLDLTASSPQ